MSSEIRQRISQGEINSMQASKHDHKNCLPYYQWQKIYPVYQKYKLSYPGQANHDVPLSATKCCQCVKIWNFLIGSYAFVSLYISGFPFS